MFLVALLLLCAGWIAPALQPQPKVVQITHGPVGELGPAVSPDGQWLAIEFFPARHPASPEIWIMPSRGRFADAKPILNDDSMTYGEIAWSPDSAWLSFIGSRGVKSGWVVEQVFKVNIKTREVVQLTDLNVGLGAGTSWSNDGRIAFAMDGGIYVVSESGGVVTKLLDVQEKLPHVDPFFPAWSPDLSHLAFVGRSTAEAQLQEHNLYIADLHTGAISKVFSEVGDDGPSWFDTNHILVSHDDSKTKTSLWLVPILKGRATRLTHGFYDVAGAIGRPPTYLYFARNKDDLTVPRPLDQLTKGFHIWRQTLRPVSVVTR